MNIQKKDDNKPEREKSDIGLDDFNEPGANDVNPYPAKIDFNKEQYSLFDLKRKIDEYEEIILDPDFQRNPDIWPNPKKIRLIESILMGIPLPLFYFAEQRGGKLAIVDGLQRITTILEYMNDGFPLKSLTYLDNSYSCKFSQLHRDDQAQIEKYQIQANVINSKTPEKIKLDIFERINSGGSPLNKQEMRNAMYLGKSTKLLKKLATFPTFEAVIQTQVDKKRMRDRYIILRFLAFYLWCNKEQYAIDSLEITADFDSLLAKTMTIINAFSDGTISELENLFYRVTQHAYELYKEDAFKRDHKSTSRFNMTMFESLLLLLAKVPEIPQNKKTSLKNAIEQIFDESIIASNFENSLKGKANMISHFEYLQNSLLKVEQAIC